MDTSFYVDEFPLLSEEHEVLWLNVQMHEALCVQPSRALDQAVADVLNLVPWHRKDRLLSKPLAKITSCKLRDNT
jgi:hypothetical protein